MEQRFIALFNGDELVDIFLISACDGKNPDSGGRNRQVCLIRERILIVQEHAMVDLQQIIVAIRQLEVDGEGTILELFRIQAATR